MFRNQYDNDASTWSPQGRIFQIEYAIEAVKQGSAVVGLKSNTHAVLVARSPNELASYQKKIVKIDKHMGVAIAGLTSDARVLGNYLRSEAMRFRMVYDLQIPVGRAMEALGSKAQTNTQVYGGRPYGVGLLVIGKDSKGPHLFEFSPSGMTSEYFAFSIGSRSQTARTYLERNYAQFENMDLKTLIKEGLTALKDTLPQDKQLDAENTSIAFVGVDQDLTIVDGPEVAAYLETIDSTEMELE
ncbi:Proteasome subunit alpha type-1 [Smittium mucronatum]|uniref:Proteasome subunit alpha type n=1 Tax=Smittium mucronatum TaxID=133383 RepID=A0A1R0GRY1_9FUNG|nr:Proteasome subunit alpha type-1 [Smittium mucronatum]OLY84594.1 Proteasome subunit alpha type-1 [Smittium mucronatum]